MSSSDGSTVSDHVESAKSNPFASAMSQDTQDKVKAIEIEPPMLPSSAQFAWMYFLRLNQTRQQGGFGGFFSITYQEMKAFFDLEGEYPEPYELELIRVWDKIALKHLNKKENTKS